MAASISHETIYNAFYAMPCGELRAEVLRLPRRKHPHRQARSPERLPGRHDADRPSPAEVGERIVPGHWEGDHIKGKMNRSRVGTLVERTTLFVALVKLEDGCAETTANGFASVLNRFQSPMRLSMTYDQGREMAHHKRLEQATGIKVYFAHPHSPGSAASTKTLMACCATTCPKARASASTPNSSWTRSPWNSTPESENPSA